MRQLKIVQSITQRNDLTTKYIADVSKMSFLITPEREIELAKRIRQGDIKAEQELVQANLRFVMSVAKQYYFPASNYIMSLNDLINEGNLGLIKAAKRFDETRGFKFISYAVWWVRQSILESINQNNRIIKLPSNRVAQAGKIKQAIHNFEQKNERSPTKDEVCEMLNISESTYNLMNESIVFHSSLDGQIGSDESNTTLLDVLSDNGEKTDQKVMNESLTYDVNSVLKLLSHTERDVLKMYYGIGAIESEKHGLTLEEIGSKMDLSRERIRQIKDKALVKLRRSTKINRLTDYSY